MASKLSKWSQHVTETSDAMDVDAGTFKQRSAAKIAHDVERDAEKSTRRKATSYRSAMSMLTFYINRAGSNLSATQRKVLEHAKDILRDEYGPEAGTAGTGGKTARKKAVSKKTSSKKKAGSKKKSVARRKKAP